MEEQNTAPKVGEVQDGYKFVGGDPSRPESWQQQEDATPDTRNGIQKAFDKMMTVTPEQEAGHGPVINKMQEFGAGAIQGATQPFVHPIETLKGVGKIGSALLGDEDAANDIVGGVKNAGVANMAGNLVGGGVTGMGLAEAGAPLMARIPTRAKAGALLGSLDKDLADTPVNLNHSAAPLQRAAELSVRTGASPAPFNAFLSRSQGLEPMTFPEARDYQSGMSNPSVMDKLSTSGKMRGAVKQLNKGFYNDIRDSADTIGRGEDFDKGMRDYRNAALLNKGAKMAGAGVAASVVGPKLLRYLKPLVAE